jgi:predicted transcriptional regulator
MTWIRKRPLLPFYDGDIQDARRPIRGDSNVSHLSAPCKSYFTSPVTSIDPSRDINEAYAMMAEADIGCIVAVKDGRLAGLVTRTDLLRLGTRQAGTDPRAAVITLPHRTMEEVMTAKVVMVHEEESIRRAAQLMVKHSIHRVIAVNESEEPTGIVSTRDLMLAVRDQKMSLPVEDFMSCPAFTIRAEEHVSEAIARLERAHISGLAVVDGHWPVGVFTQRDALLFKDVARSTAVEEVMDPSVLIVPTTTKMHRAAAQASAMRARRILVASGNDMVGVITGLTFARAIAE